MGPNLELKSKSVRRQAPAFSSQIILEPGVNYIEEACGMETMPIEQPPMSNGDEDVEVNITECTNSGKALEVDDDDATECSSSFADTGSGTENEPSFSEPEIESSFCADDLSLSMFGDCSESLQIRKKKVTSHWKRFISPLMWRCKWTELRLRQLKSQEQKYHKELAAYNHTKQLDFAHLTFDGCDIKSVPVTGRMHRNKIMKRNKRNRVEEKCDLASYTSNHNLFSYYEQTGRTVGACSKNFRGVAPVTSGGNIDDIEFKLDDLWTYVDYENVDESLNDIVQKIEAVGSQIHSLKTRTEKVTSENTARIDFVARSNMLGPSDGFNHAELNSAPFTGEQNMQMPEPIDPEYHVGNAWFVREWVTPLNETINRSELVDLCDEDDQSVEEELHDLENVGDARVSEADVAVDDAVPKVHSSLKPCPILKLNIPKNKRKRRERSGSKSWSLRSFD